jgi:SpoVK/Ycf46/Vps4 family AAA+-type ATPase
MSDLSKFPSPIKEIWAARCGGKGAIILEQNTNDRIICAEAGLIQPMSIRYAIYSTFGQMDYQMGEINKVEGFRAVTPPHSPKTENGKCVFPRIQGDPKSAVYFSQYTRMLFRKESKVLLLINGADLLLPDIEPGMMPPDQTDLLHLFIELGLNDSFRQTQNIVILKSLQGSINKALLRSGAFFRIPVPLPNEAARKEFVIYLRNHSEYGETIPRDMSADEMAKLSNGTRLIDIEDLAKSCRDKNKTIDRKDINIIKSSAIHAISQGQLEVVIPEKTMADVIGLDQIKRFLKRQVDLARSMNSSSMPSMMLFVGQPGCGKSHMFEAYANELGWSYLKIANLRSMWVGQSEALTQQALEIIEQCAPCIVEVDECDQILGGRSVNAGDAGVDARIFGMILAATGNSRLRGKVQWLMATNRPDILDSALLDRAGERLVFMNPPASDRAVLFQFLSKQQGRQLDENVQVDVLAREPNLGMVSVRNLIEIIGKAAEFADQESGQINSILAQRHLLRAIREFNVGDTLEIEFIALHSLNNLRFKDRLPWIDENGQLIAGYDFPPYLQGIVDPETGKLNIDELIKRLRSYKQLRMNEKIMR